MDWSALPVRLLMWYDFRWMIIVSSLADMPFGCLINVVSSWEWRVVDIHLWPLIWVTVLWVEVFQRCVLLVQTFVLSAGYSPKTFFTDLTLDALCAAFATAGVFYVTPGLNPWGDLCSPDVKSDVMMYQSSFTKFLAERRRSFDVHYIDSNNGNRLSRAEQRGVTVARVP